MDISKHLLHDALQEARGQNPACVVHGFAPGLSDLVQATIGDLVGARWSFNSKDKAWDHERACILVRLLLMEELVNSKGRTAESIISDVCRDIKSDPLILWPAPKITVSEPVSAPEPAFVERAAEDLVPAGTHNL